MDTCIMADTADRRKIQIEAEVNVQPVHRLYRQPRRA